MRRERFLLCEWYLFDIMNIQPHYFFLSSLSLTHEIVAHQLTRAYQTQCPCGCRPFVTHQRLSRCGLRLNWTMVKANRKQTTNVWWWNWIVCTPRRCGEYSYQWNLPKCIILCGRVERTRICCRIPSAKNDMLIITWIAIANEEILRQ